MDSNLKAKLIAGVREREKGYSDHPADKGGPTMDGVTQATARRYGYQGDMRDIPSTLIDQIYADLYWQPLNLDEFSTLSEDLTVVLFDFGVNSGTGRAAKDLQRALNVLNRRGADYPDIVADGAIGPKTMASVSAFAAKRGDEGVEMLADIVNGMRLSFLVELSERDESQEAFTFGWLRRVIHLLWA
ncbi:glycoside hydrolase family 108 protein [Salinicola peritrichatus]|uniref:glycoside hydrolase family 108 protein n=1 Tax=Salinicola peritrichatus TaxID=1267424 RepID=UPI000DA15ED0|nr:glycosyl hydrolase 108 family protein [Salinicola peritrichatus]